MRIRWLLCAAALCAVGTLAATAASPTPATVARAQPAGTVTGTVIDEDGAPVPGATVRVQAANLATTTDDEGRFLLTGLHDGMPVTISAWKHLYYCAKVEGIVPPALDVTLTLRLYQTTDNPDYEWIPPVGENSCASCKPSVTQIWLDNDAHARSSANPRFLTMYNGTDVAGDQSPLTRYGYSRDYGRFPLRPDPSQPYYGPGYKLDFPDAAGNCAACHTPGAAVDAPYGTDPNTVSGADSFGVHCDFCHKIADVTLDPATGRPFANMPGVLSMDIRRPFPDDPDRYQLFFGTFDDDNVPMEDTYLPLLQESQYCAPCHYGVFWDTVIYNSFGEWLDSPYGKPSTGKTCQQCHMPAPSELDGELLTNVAPGMGGVERDPLTLYAHTQPGAANLHLLQNTAELRVTVERSDNELTVTVHVTNTQAGHDIPTDSPLRQIFAVVSATDENGTPLTLVSGPVLPAWAGDLQGQPGVYFAKILQEVWTEIMPSGAYWNPTRIAEDTRLSALESHTSAYTFSVPPTSGDLIVGAELVYRRAYYDLAVQKGWDMPDIVMEDVKLTVSP